MDINDTTGIDDVLAHFGIPGMKWGQRKASGSRTLGGPNLSVKAQRKIIAKAKEVHAKAQAKRAPEHLATKVIKRSPAKNLTDAQLKQAVARMNLERSYNSVNPKGLSKGQKQVTAILALGASINAAIAFGNSPFGKVIINSIKQLNNPVTTTAVKEVVKVIL